MEDEMWKSDIKMSTTYWDFTILKQVQPLLGVDCYWILERNLTSGGYRTRVCSGGYKSQEEAEAAVAKMVREAEVSRKEGK